MVKCGGICSGYKTDEFDFSPLSWSQTQSQFTSVEPFFALDIGEFSLLKGASVFFQGGIIQTNFSLYDQLFPSNKEQVVVSVG